MRFSSVAAYSSWPVGASGIAPGQQRPAYGSVASRAVNMSAPFTTSIVPPSSRTYSQNTASPGRSAGPLQITVTPTPPASLAARGKPKPGNNGGGGGNSQKPTPPKPTNSKPTNSKGEVCPPSTTTFTGSAGELVTRTYNPCLPTSTTGARRGPAVPWKGWF